MKLYALIAHVMEDTELLGVYDSRNAAEAQKTIGEGKGWGASVAIYEMTLGESYEDGIVRATQ
jgi:hypothetical protein